MNGEQAIFNLEIKKKSGLSLNPDIHHSKVFSSEFIVLTSKVYNKEIRKSGSNPLWKYIEQILRFSDKY